MQRINKAAERSWVIEPDLDVFVDSISQVPFVAILASIDVTRLSRPKRAIAHQ